MYFFYYSVSGANNDKYLLRHNLMLFTIITKYSTFYNTTVGKIVTLPKNAAYDHLLVCSFEFIQHLHFRSTVNPQGRFRFYKCRNTVFFLAPKSPCFKGFA